MADVIDSGNTAWVLISTALVLLMTPGLAFFYGGLVGEENALNTIMMCIISMGVVAVPWMLCGFSLAFGSDGHWFIGDFRYAGLSGMDDLVWPGTTLPALIFVVFQMTFAVIGAAIISGAVVERMRFGVWFIFIFVWSLLVYVPICHWVWGPGGWIQDLGALDFAGGAVVHESTAVSALVLAKFLGPRIKHGTPDSATPHNVPHVVLGAALLWFGWSGFNGGSALAADSLAALALFNTYEAAGSALVVWTILDRCRLGTWSAIGTVTGAIVGLVVITPAAGFVSPLGAFFVGVLGALCVYPSFQLEKSIDDSLDAFPCHGVSGFVGTLLTGVFAKDGGLVYGGGWRLLGVQLAAALAVSAYAAVMTGIICFIMSRIVRMRVHKDHEKAGIDNFVHGQAAYAHTPTKKYGPPVDSRFHGAGMETSSGEGESGADSSDANA